MKTSAEESQDVCTYDVELIGRIVIASRVRWGIGRTTEGIVDEKQSFATIKSTSSPLHCAQTTATLLIVNDNKPLQLHFNEQTHQFSSH